MTEIHIPESVTKIGEGVFEDCTGLIEIHIPDSVTEIGKKAFCGCTGLTEIHIPESVTKIGYGAFRGCTGLTEITVSKSNKEYDSRNNCNAIIRVKDNVLEFGCKTTIIPESVTEIEVGAFDGCTGLTKIHIPKSVTEIGVGAFSHCTDLTEIHIPESVTKIEDYAFRGCTGLIEIHIPESVTKIEDYAFRGCAGLTEINIPESVTEIGECAFYGCTGLTEIHIPESVTKIGKSAFYGCTGLTKIHIPKSVTEIEVGAFHGCTGLTKIHIPESVTKIENYAFYGCTGLTEINIPESVTEIGGCAFSCCIGLTEIHIPESVTKIGKSAFYGCTGLTKIHIPESVTKIENYAFYGCTGLTKIHIPESVTTIEGYAFRCCTGLIEIHIPESVTKIGERAFCSCTGLTEIHIPESVTTIEDEAFLGCTGLTEIHIPKSVTTIHSDAFMDCSFNTIYVPVGKANYYKKMLDKDLHKIIVEASAATELQETSNKIVVHNNSNWNESEVDDYNYNTDSDTLIKAIKKMMTRRGLTKINLEDLEWTEVFAMRLYDNDSSYDLYHDILNITYTGDELLFLIDCTIHDGDDGTEDLPQKEYNYSELIEYKNSYEWEYFNLNNALLDIIRQLKEVEPKDSGKNSNDEGNNNDIDWDESEVDDYDEMTNKDKMAFAIIKMMECRGITKIEDVGYNVTDLRIAESIAEPYRLCHKVEEILYTNGELSFLINSNMTDDEGCWSDKLQKIITYSKVIEYLEKGIWKDLDFGNLLLSTIEHLKEEIKPTASNDNQQDSENEAPDEDYTSTDDDFEDWDESEVENVNSHDCKEVLDTIVKLMKHRGLNDHYVDFGHLKSGLDEDDDTGEYIQVDRVVLKNGKLIFKAKEYTVSVEYIGKNIESECSFEIEDSDDWILSEKMELTPEEYIDWDSKYYGYLDDFYNEILMVIYEDDE